MKDMIEFANMHSKARVAAKVSQEKMAYELGVSKKTIRNWENGKTSPSFYQSLQWFNVLNVNPFPLYIDFVNQEVKHDNKYKSEGDIRKAFEELTECMPVNTMQALLYLFTGEHGSSPTAVIELGLAYLHLPLKTRASHTSMVIHDYETEERLNNLFGKDNLPNMEVLIHAFENANKSILNRLDSYNVID